MKVKPLHSALFLGVVTRGLFYVLILLADCLITDHDAQGVMKIFGNADSWTSSFSKWDSVYYLRISLQGYQDEKDFAFFPLYPFLISLGMKIIGTESVDAAVKVGLAINVLSFILTIPVLWKLLTIIPSFPIGRIQSILFFFILSPSTVFFLTVYTESLFCLLAYSGMLFLQLGWVVMGSLCFFFASMTRSNGIFNVVFILCYYLQRFFSKPGLNLYSSCLQMVYASMLSGLPFIIHSIFAYFTLCTSSLPLNFDSDLCPMEADSGICQHGILSVYSSLQLKHWNVGLFRQYQLKQIPNFLLALPIISLALQAIISVMLRPNSRMFQSLIPYAVHIFSLLIVVIFSAHIQISTRVLLSSSPLLYITLPFLLLPKVDHKFPTQHPLIHRFLLFWWLSYLIGGMILHTNNFPWT